MSTLCLRLNYQSSGKITPCKVRSGRMLLWRYVQVPAISTIMPHTRNVSGYGERLPTSKMVKINNRWHRVYCTIYSNSGTCWIERTQHGKVQRYAIAD